MHLGLIGYGSIATNLLDLIGGSGLTGLTVLVRPTTKVPDTASHKTPVQNIPIRFVADAECFLSAQPDLVVECAGHAAVADHIPAFLVSGHDVVLASVGALADQTLAERVFAAADEGDAHVILPSGAIGGLDMLRAAALAGEVQVTYRGIKPPKAWAGTSAETVVELDALDMARTIFVGTGREAALAYPKNANVVAALALAGAGFDRMQVELVADPTVQTNQHIYEVTSPLCRFSMAIEATPSSGNARTSMTTVLSILQEIVAYRDRM